MRGAADCYHVEAAFVGEEVVGRVGLHEACEEEGEVVRHVEGQHVDAPAHVTLRRADDALVDLDGEVALAELTAELINWGGGLGGNRGGRRLKQMQHT